MQFSSRRKKKRGIEYGEDAKWGQHSTELETDWKDIVKLVENIGLTLVPNENFTTEEGKTKRLGKTKENESCGI